VEWNIKAPELESKINIQCIAITRVTPKPRFRRNFSPERKIYRIEYINQYKWRWSPCVKIEDASIANGQNSFKSRGEREIARFLDERGISFCYEYPLAIVDRDKTRLVYPDFRLQEYDVIIEYFGMNGNREYNEQAARKMASYNESGFNAIFLFDSTMRGNWREMVIERIAQTLEGRLRKLQNIRNQMNSERQNVG